MKQHQSNRQQPDKLARRARSAKRRESDRKQEENEKRFDRMFDQSFWPDVHSD